jgi:hypothetical protein
MKSWLGVAIAVCLLQACVAQAGEGTILGESTVIWLSWDGVRHDYPERGRYLGLERMAREGARAERLLPVYPSSTFPNHVALATCAHSDRHGIIENRFIDRERGEFAYGNDASWIEAEPIWVAAERQGVASATFFWVGSESDWNGVGSRHRIAPFDGDVPESQKVDQILAWLDLKGPDRPRLIMSWWHGADRSGHLKGPYHRDIARDLAQQDAQLQRLQAGIDARGLWSETTLIVTSDHGMTEATRGINLVEILGDAGIEAKVRSGAGVANVYLADLADLERAKSEIDRHEGPVSFRQHELPEVMRLRHRERSGDLVVITEPPFFFVSQPPRAVWVQWGMRVMGFKTGHHGYSVSHPDMSGILFMMGQGAAGSASLGVVSNLAIAPTAAQLLGIEPPRDCEGRAIPASRRILSSPPATD